MTDYPTAYGAVVMRHFTGRTVTRHSRFRFESPGGDASARRHARNEMRKWAATFAPGDYKPVALIAYTLKDGA